MPSLFLEEMSANATDLFPLKAFQNHDVPNVLAFIRGKMALPGDPAVLEWLA